MPAHGPPGRADGSEDRTIWLSGAVQTLLNKLVFPVVWISAMAGITLRVLVQTGRLSIAPGFRFLAALVLMATVFMLWMSARLERVGYRGRELVVANYWREAHIRFEQVAAVESVWWYWRRMVRIQFREQTPFGSTVYYLPKWGPIRCFFEAPEEELRTLLSPDTTTLES